VFCAGKRREKPPLTLRRALRGRRGGPALREPLGEVRAASAALVLPAESCEEGLR